MSARRWVHKEERFHAKKKCRKERGHKIFGASGPLMEKRDKRKVPVIEGGKVEEGPDKDGFIPIKPKAKGRGQKWAYKDRQSDQGFNHFEVLENHALEGIPVEISSGATDMDTGLEQAIVVKDTSLPLEQGGLSLLMLFLVYMILF